MGAQSSAQRDGKSQEDASASASASTGEMSAEVKVIQEGGGVPDSKVQLVLPLSSEPDLPGSLILVHTLALCGYFYVYLCVCKHTSSASPQTHPTPPVKTMAVCASVRCCSAQALFLLSNGSRCLQSRSNKTPATQPGPDLRPDRPQGLRALLRDVLDDQQQLHFCL